MRRLVIVGNGNAARAFLRQIQRHRRDFAITVFSAGKPPQPVEWYRERGIDMRAGVTITAIDRHARVAKGSDGSRTSYDRLILAIGRNQLPPAGLAGTSGVIVNRSLETSDGHIYALGDCVEIGAAGISESLDQLARRLAARVAADGVSEDSLAAYAANPAAPWRPVSA